MKPHIYADFQNADVQGRVRLNTVGTLEDLHRGALQLEEGMALLLYCDDSNGNGDALEMQADGIVAYSGEERDWVAQIDWSAIRHVDAAHQAMTRSV